LISRLMALERKGRELSGIPPLGRPQAAGGGKPRTRVGLR